ncbi:hypothetical protein BDQ12DRAFT_685593, partial [Crucibulum laeve]
MEGKEETYTDTYPFHANVTYMEPWNLKSASSPSSPRSSIQFHIPCLPPFICPFALLTFPFRLFHAYPHPPSSQSPPTHAVYEQRLLQLPLLHNFGLLFRLLFCIHPFPYYPVTPYTLRSHTLRSPALRTPPTHCTIHSSIQWTRSRTQTLKLYPPTL